MSRSWDEVREAADRAAGYDVEALRAKAAELTRQYEEFYGDERAPVSDVTEATINNEGTDQ